MMTRPTVVAWVVPFQRSFLLAVTLKNGRIHIQGIAFGTQRQSLHLPLGHRLAEALDLAHAKLPEQITDRVVGGKTFHPQHTMQRLIASQQTSVSKAFGAYQHGHQERYPRRRWLDLVWWFPLNWRMTSYLLHQADLLHI